nr:sulfatase-like hydrolase/transferase [Halomarina oriensis]
MLITSDEHRPDALGAAGHPLVETPTFDRFAATGIRFTSAYCSSPLCAPSRASFATGRYVHDTGHWDNATPYDGTPRSWGHHFVDHGVDVTTVGKLDFEPDCDDGFDDQRVAFHRETPDVNGLHRDPPIVRDGARDRIEAAGSAAADGEAWYCEREDRVTDETVAFLEARAEEAAGDGEGKGSGTAEPWVCWTNYILPHFPLVAEPSYYERYPETEVDLPTDYPPGDDHPILDELRSHFDGADLDEATLRRTRAAYYALCTALDDHVGQLLDALDRLGLAEDTLVVYASDHGEPLGDHGVWWKCCMYEPSVGVPLAMRGPGVAGRTVDAPVSLLDLVPTMADAVGVPHDSAWRGRSLLDVACGDAPDDDRAVFSEYHAHGVSRGMFMLRQGRYKYVYYPDNPDQLFDLESDPDELTNLAGTPEYTDVRERFERRLRVHLDEDPDAVDERARRDQRERLAELGGPD